MLVKWGGGVNQKEIQFQTCCKFYRLSSVTGGTEDSSDGHANFQLGEEGSAPVNWINSGIYLSAGSITCILLSWVHFLFLFLPERLTFIINYSLADWI